MTATATLIDNSQSIAATPISNGDADSVYMHYTSLYRHKSGKWYTIESGGGAVRVDRQPHWMDRAEAVNWIATEARDPVTGYGYSREQAEIMVDGGDADKGYRDIN